MAVKPFLPKNIPVSSALFGGRYNLLSTAKPERLAILFKKNTGMPDGPKWRLSPD
jgi:hypothetical protein